MFKPNTPGVLFLFALGCLWLSLVEVHTCEGGKLKRGNLIPLCLNILPICTFLCLSRSLLVAYFIQTFFLFSTNYNGPTGAAMYTGLNVFSRKSQESGITCGIRVSQRWYFSLVPIFLWYFLLVSIF